MSDLKNKKTVYVLVFPGKNFALFAFKEIN